MSTMKQMIDAMSEGVRSKFERFDEVLQDESEVGKPECGEGRWKADPSEVESVPPGVGGVPVWDHG